MGKKISIDLGGDDEDEIEALPIAPTKKVKEMAASLPSAHKARVQAIKEAPRKQFAFSQFPVPVIEMFEKEAKRRNMTKKAYIFHCLKAGGLDIPEFSEIDARRR